MKRILLLLITLHSSLIILFSQAPQGFNYQAVARDNGGELLASQTIDVKIGIRAGSESGTLVWEETHTVMTNEFGLFTLMIGDPEAQQGSGSAATFSEIEWGTGAHYLEVSIKTDADFILMGTSELLSVPFALFAEEGNEDQDLHLSGDILTIDNGVNNIDLSYYLDNTDNQGLNLSGDVLSISGGGGLVDLSLYGDDADADLTNELQSLTLDGNTLGLTNDATTVSLSKYLDDSNPWSLGDGTIFFNKGNVGIGTESPGSHLEVMGNMTGDPVDPLFEVKRKDGQTVFAVYEDSVRIFVNTEETGKGTKGGFAVGGFAPGKGEFEQEYLRVTPDSVRIYIDETITGKGTKGGFAVGGFNPATKSSPVSLLHLSKENYFIGHESGVETTGLYNTFFGYQSGMSNVGGSYNVFIGYQSGISNYNGNNNVFLGLRAGYNNTNGGDNTFIGNWSGYYNHTGSNNIIIGKLAGVDNLSNNNIFLGNESGRNNETGDRNIYFGYKAGYLATDASNNVFIGDSAGYGASSGYNICIGNSSGISLTSGGNNVLIGRQAGYNTTTASSTVTIGNKAGYHSNDDDGCVFIGNMAGYHNVNGDYNTLIGFFSGYNVTGHFNTYVGEAAGYDWYNQNKVNDGTGNTLLGYYSGSEITSGDYNTLVGYAAGFGVAGGNNNVIIGRNAGHEVGSGSGNVFIGYEAGYNEAGSSKLYIDNSNTSTPLIYGDFDSDLLQFNGNVGVNTSPASDKGIRASQTNVGSGDRTGIYSTGSGGDHWNYGVYGSAGTGGTQGFGVWGTASGSTQYNIGVFGIASGTGAYALYASGNIGYTGSLIDVSDIKLKENIEPVENALTKIMKVKPHTFTFKTDQKFKSMNFPEGRQYGFIAQELEEIFPELVVKKIGPVNPASSELTDEGIDYKGVKYVEMIPILLKAIQEQQEMIEQLQERIEQIEKK